LRGRNTAFIILPGRTDVVMCGIVGYIGPRKALRVVIDNLKKLEYRGYDSAGVAVVENGRPVIVKKKGKIADLESSLDGQVMDGQLGIGHTRWATHGVPSDRNAHPHPDCTGEVVVVHNGIIENYAELRRELREAGHKLASETDTEVIPHLIEANYNGSLEEAVRAAVSRLEGAYALVVISSREPDKIICVRKDSPLVIGLGEGENFVASDIPALLRYTRDTYILDDHEMAVITREGVQVKDVRTGEARPKEVFTVTWDAGQAEKGGYAHFMLKEIHEQPTAVRETLRGRLKEGGVSLPEIPEEVIRDARRVFMVACGTAYHACLVGKYLMERIARVPVEADLASEFRYRDPLIGPGDVMVLVSQSGETADTLAALREGRNRGAHVVAITNVRGSSIDREADAVIHTLAGPEIAVASTKAYTTQLVALTLLALRFAEVRGGDREQIAALVEGLKNLPELVQEVLDTEDEIKELARKYSSSDDVFFIGRGLDYAVAMEGQLKLKEISYIHAEAYAAGELKHGTLALIEAGVPVVALVTQPDLYEKMVSNITEVRARQGRIISVVYDDDEKAREFSDEMIRIPRTDPLLAPVLAVVPLQLLAYYVAVERGCEVDKPRNLAKSVTVE